MVSKEGIRGAVGAAFPGMQSKEAEGHFTVTRENRNVARSKAQTILEALKSPAGLNRFEAERLGDHCLNSTIATLRRSYAIRDIWETVPCRFSKKGVRVKRYYLENP